MPSAQKYNEKYMVSCLTEPLIQEEAQTHNSKEKALEQFHIVYQRKTNKCSFVVSVIVYVGKDNLSVPVTD